MEQNFDFNSLSFNDTERSNFSPLPKEEKKDKDKKTGLEKMFNSNKLKKPRMVAVLFLRNNGTAEPMDLEVKKGFFEIYGQTYHEDKDCIWRFTKEGLPLAIIEEDSLIPMGTKRYYHKYPMENDLQFMKRKLMAMQDHVLRGIRHAEFVRMGEKQESKMNPKTLLIWGIILIVGYALWKGGVLG